MIKLFKHLKPYKWLILIVVILVITTSIATLFLPDFMSKIIGEGIGIENKVVQLPDGSITMIPTQVIHMDKIWKNGGIMLLITLGSSILSVGVAFLSSKVAMSYGKDLRAMIFKKIVNFSQTQEEKFGTASLITRSTSDVSQVQMLTMMGMRMMLTVPIMFVGGMIMAINKSSKMTLVLLGSIPIVAVFIFIVARKIIPMFKIMQERIDHLTLVARENITGVRVIRAFGGEVRENKRYTQANKDVMDVGIKSARIMSSLMPLMTLIMSLTSISILLIAIFDTEAMLKKGTVDFYAISNMMAVIQYIMQIMMSIVMCTMIFIMVPRAAVSGARINEVLDSKNDIEEPTQPLTSKKVSMLEFKNVSFKFTGAQKPAIENISFKCNMGETTAIVGSTGSGKSTIINLIPRLYDATEGAVLVDGVDVKSFSTEVLREKIGFVPQKAMLMSGTIRENILYGSLDSSNENLARAATIAQALDFINNKENGFDSVVEQGGANFSGGQKQRLSIARAIAKKPELYIFDDSFSALDFKTDALLRKAIRDNIKDATILIVAQRIGSIMDADNIIVMDEGKMVGYGKHQDLFKNCEVYRDIALSQLSAEEIEQNGGAK